MKNTKSRKKILLSSIAMLLVALVALGSATYAWFTVQKTVTADKMKVTVAKHAGIKITTDNGTTWGTNESWGDGTAVDNKLFPVSFNTATNATGAGYAPSAADHDGRYTDNSTAITGFTAVETPSTLKPTTTDATTGDAENAGSYFAVYRFGVKNDTDAGTTVARTGVKAKIELDTTTSVEASYVRAALVSDDFSTVYGTYANAAAAATDNPAQLAISAISPSVTTAAQTLTQFGTLSSPLANIAADGTATYYNIVVWFEGEDGDCVDAKNVATVPLKLTLSYGNS